MTPDNPIVGGTSLRIPAIQSPNFQPGVAGWQISADGDAEFNELTIISGVQITSSGIFCYG